MASTTALYTGLSGLTVNARSLDVIGNNIANANTTAFKSSRMIFATQFSRNLSAGSGPGTFTGGTNPRQIGLGAVVAGTQRNFTAGSLSVTGDQRDLAIDGQGFFVVNRGSTPFYTRAGSFRQNSANELVTISGERLQGYTVDEDFNIIRGQLSSIRIPTGTLTVAEATRTASFTGQLNAAGPLPVHGSQHTFAQIFPRAGGPATVDGTTLLTDVSDTSGGPAQYSAGQIFTVTEARKGTQKIDDRSLTITATTTVDDLMAFIAGAVGINPAAGRNPDGILPGVTIDTAGVITVDGNAGLANTLDLTPSNFKLFNADGTTADSSVFTPSLVRAADGESVRTTATIYDSLGGPVDVEVTMVLAQLVGGSGTIWRWYAESGDNQGTTGINVGTGTIEFNENGQIQDPSAFNVSVDRTGTGAATPLDVSFDFRTPTGNVVSFKNGSGQPGGSTLKMFTQDGAPAGTLDSYSVGDDGIITGSFSNGRTRPLGQVAIATFSNEAGLVEVGSSLFTVGSNSGVPVISQPQELGAGALVGGSLELSNTELSQEFINLILASTGFSAASRVISTTDQLMQQLVALGR